MADPHPPTVTLGTVARRPFPVQFPAGSYTDAAVFFGPFLAAVVAARTPDHAGTEDAWDLAEFVAAAVRAYAATPAGLAHWAAARPDLYTRSPTTTTTPPPEGH